MLRMMGVGLTGDIIINDGNGTWIAIGIGIGIAIGLLVLALVAWSV